MAYQNFFKITIVVPLDAEQAREAPLHPEEAILVCSPLQPMLECLRNSDPVGRTGNYTGVYGLNARAGGYVAAQGSAPVKGTIGSDEMGLCYELITYMKCNADETALVTFTDAIVALHPWEHPTIEIEEIKIWMP